jgi:ElaB/YqjD/DUF883 family membrane-anchored ribosome-binding protein
MLSISQTIPFHDKRRTKMSTTKPSNEPQASPNVSDRISDAVEQTKTKLNEFSTAANEKIDENRIAAASGLEGAADKLSATADYLRENDMNSMINDVQGFVKKNPGPALVVAAGLGFLIARAFSGNSRG